MLAGGILTSFIQAFVVMSDSFITGIKLGESAVVGVNLVLPVYSFAKNMACNNKMDMEILDSRNRFGVLVDYDAGVYERSTAEAFANLFCRACSELINVTDHTVSVRDLTIFSAWK